MENLVFNHLKRNLLSHLLIIKKALLGNYPGLECNCSSNHFSVIFMFVRIIILLVTPLVVIICIN